ncbi:MAG: hypothetical protein R3A48_11955 [Polyangiales bacterium]
MIRIGVKGDDLRARIEAASPGWLDDAKARTQAAVAAGKVGEGEGTWSKIKEVYIALQHHKCAYCEQPMAKTTEGSADKVAVDYDVEHFRPKNRVTPWPNAEVLRRRPALDYASLVKAGHGAGYVRLAFEPTNYVVSCKVCNSSYKADRFPIAGTASETLVDRTRLDARERPLLLFPMGDDGDDPADYLGFVGPVPRHTSGEQHGVLRARTVIDFFELDTREDLFGGRCWVIAGLFPHLEARVQGKTAARRKVSGDFVDAAVGDASPYAACARDYVALYDADPAAAEEMYLAASAYCAKKDPSVFAALTP